MSDIITVEVAQVYRVGNRRFLTKRAACESVARGIIATHCHCDPGDAFTPGWSCKHHDPERYPALLRRLTRSVARRFTA